MGLLLATALASMPAVEVVRLADNNLSDKSLPALIDAIERSSTIKEVDLSENDLDECSATMMADIMGRPACDITSLKLSRCDVSDSECALFVNALLRNTTLEVSE